MNEERRAHLQGIWGKAVANGKALDACERHRFTIDLTPDKPLGKRWQCRHCGGEVDAHAKYWYELGCLQADN